MENDARSRLDVTKKLPSAQVASQHTEEEVRDTLGPIAKILQEAGEFERGAKVLREWVGVSASRNAREAFCKLLKASPAGIACALEWTLDTKGHWFRNHRLDRGFVDRVVALAVEDRRRAAVVRVCLRGREIGGRVPAELGRLTNLEVVNLSSNELTGRSRSRMLRATRQKRIGRFLTRSPFPRCACRTHPGRASALEVRRGPQD